MGSVFVLFSRDENSDDIFFNFEETIYQTISPHVAKFSVYVRFLKLQCDKHHDIIDAVTGTINTTSTAAGGATTATTSADVDTTSQASTATTNPGMSLCYLTPSALSVV